MLTKFVNVVRIKEMTKTINIFDLVESQEGRTYGEAKLLGV
jgi:hypothetical protein